MRTPIQLDDTPRRGEDYIVLGEAQIRVSTSLAPKLKGRVTFCNGDNENQIVLESNRKQKSFHPISPRSPFVIGMSGPMLRHLVKHGWRQKVRHMVTVVDGEFVVTRNDD